MPEHLISIKDWSKKEIEGIFSKTDELRESSGKSFPLRGKSIALIFEKPSGRTRVSFEVAMFELGGNSIYLGQNDIQLGVRETIPDVARVLSGYVHGIVIRTFEHKKIVKLAEGSTIPVINGLSDYLHPCQILADLYTIKKRKGGLEGVKLAFIGDGNNVCNSWIYGAVKMGLRLRIASPPGYEPSGEIIAGAGENIRVFKDPKEAAGDADIIYTDVWASMGEEDKLNEKVKSFENYQVNAELVDAAKSDVLVMHCLPAHRGQEITDSVIAAPKSLVFEQAENRLHVEKAILVKLLGR